MMRHIDIFTGIGGWPLGFSWAFSSYEPIVFCEQDKFCQKVLKKHWPEVSIETDVFGMRGEDYGEIDIVSCSPPCQPYSQAGKQQGSKDDRVLWPECFRIIQEISPSWVCFENVRGFASIEQGLALDQVLSDLEDEGYSTQAFIIPAAGVGAPHRRERVWIVANSKSEQDCGGINDAISSQREESTRELGGSGCTTGNVVHSKITRAVRGKRTQTDATKQDGGGTGPRDVQWWQSEPNVGGVASRLSRWMDGGGLDAKAKEAGARKVLRVLWSETATDHLQFWPLGRAGNLQKEKVLQPSLCESAQTPEALGNLSLQSEEAPQGIVRGVWFNYRFACTSCRRRAGEQLPREYSDPLCALSQLLACDCGATWLETTGAVASDTWSDEWEMNIPRVTTGVINRVDRLRALGNAVVPQIPYVIGQAILEAEDSPRHKRNDKP